MQFIRWDWIVQWQEEYSFCKLYSKEADGYVEERKEIPVFEQWRNPSRCAKPYSFQEQVTATGAIYGLRGRTDFEGIRYTVKLNIALVTYSIWRLSPKNFCVMTCNRRTFYYLNRKTKFRLDGQSSWSKSCKKYPEATLTNIAATLDSHPTVTYNNNALPMRRIGQRWGATWAAHRVCRKAASSTGAAFLLPSWKQKR